MASQLEDFEVFLTWILLVAALLWSIQTSISELSKRSGSSEPGRQPSVAEESRSVEAESEPAPYQDLRQRKKQEEVSCFDLSFLYKLSFGYNLKPVCSEGSSAERVKEVTSRHSALDVVETVGSRVIGGRELRDEAERGAEVDLRRARGSESVGRFAALLVDELHLAHAAESLEAYGGRQSCLLRFLCARDGDLDAAAAMFRQTASWRAETGIGTLHGLSRSDPRWEVVNAIRPWWTGHFVGSTQDGSPVQIHRIEYLQPDKLLAFGEDNLRVFYLWFMEMSLNLQRKGHCNNKGQGTMPKCIEIYDMRNLSLRRLSRAVVGIRFFASLLRLGQQHYPENLRKAYIINAPTALAFVWRICFSVLDKETRAKVSISADDNRQELSRYIDSDSWDKILVEISDPMELAR
ncbi:unnamed protein product [Polarella glacialis]|uniref:CRAL-TRIO domain-containing protein n=1 Tax=Polarella glacialis TaxID=89957 RepID=A0A813HSN9_POLGL|nr:unnamed protein product [Polarella glacialis]|mmetsp:Transcript_65646/g.118271  ORF Transcript_65646/g.118271 Transcript_65646/m.118271 type:complete len:407 (+) Transcript_65646:41-1261(+)|eukprot:CAMPEP_0115084248 /NCGR_PEP_ID=MMETSP0227-20121206/21118_1 /TAXON_ID=89957 /ORGANISM="Polarella glacialis, Strain CCMP 1383" /LENGTH=406 /DNA_ID=CAMNT_0002472961 /DNA_START=40 /DNA_END=1260 /DNA_ORIENTATION=+